MSGMADRAEDGGRAALRIEDAVNDTCPWSGKPISADSLTLYRGFTVGFCNHGLPRHVRGGDAPLRGRTRRL